MSASALSAAKVLLAAAAVAVCGFGFAAAPAGAQPADSATTPATDETDVLPVASVLEGMWSQYVPPNSVPPGPLGPVDQLIDQFVPTTTQIRDFFAFVQQFRPPAAITPPIA